MSDRPSDGMELGELREEFDWISEFQSRMAERIREDPDVHSLVDYVGKLETDNAKLRELCGEMLLYIAYPYVCVRPSVLVERARELGVEVDG